MAKYTAEEIATFKAKEKRSQWNTNTNAIRISTPDKPEEERWREAERQVEEGLRIYPDPLPEEELKTQELPL